MDNKNRYILQTAFRAVFLITFVLGALTVDAKSKKKSSDFPDFAYPKTVVKGAESSLNKSLADKNYVGVLRSLLDLTVAHNLISNDQTIALIPRIDSIGKSLPAPYSSLAFLIEGQIYLEILENQSYRANNRIMPEGSDEEMNPLLWDTPAFTNKIRQLLLQALENKEKASSESLDKIKSIITTTPSNSFTIYDFIVYHTINIASNVPEKNSTIPFYKSDKPSFPSDISLVDQLIELHSDNSLARNTAILKKTALLDSKEGARFLWDEIIKESDSEFVVPLFTTYYNNYMARHGIMPLDSEDNISNGNEKNVSFKEFYSLLETLIQRFKDMPSGNALAQIQASITHPHVSVSSPTPVVSGKEFPITTESENVKEFYLLLLPISSTSDEYIKVSALKNVNPVAYKKVSIDRDIPFSSSDTTYMAAPKPGKYAIIVSSSPYSKDLLADKTARVPSLTVSDIDIITLNPTIENDSVSKGCYVVDATDSRPIENADVTLSFYENYSKPKKTISYTTDKSGFTPLLRDGDVNAEYNGSVSKSNIFGYQRSYTPKNNMRLFASQAVYRPGDKIEFFGIVYQENVNHGNILKGQPVEITFYDANRQKVDSLSTVSDASGRIFGSFEVPRNGLLGNWRISAKIESAETGNSYLNTFTLPIQIEEYRVPPFIITLSREESSTDSIKFTGIARTYSGMPVSFANVDYLINYQPSYTYRWNNRYPQEFASSTETDAEGNFNIILPLDNIDVADYRGFFSLTASATDGAGETVSSTPLLFWLCPDYNISGSMADVIDISSGNLTVEMKVNDAVGLPVQKQIDYIVESESGHKILDGSFNSPLLKISIADIESGKYIFKFRLKDGDENDWTVFNSILYRSTDKTPPVETALWVPVKEYISSTGKNTVDISYGSSFQGQRILCVISNSSGTIEKRWLESTGENVTLTVPAPAADQRSFVNFITYRIHQPYEDKVTVVPAEQTLKFEIKTESFRNNLTAGDKENWKFRILYGNKPIDAFAYALLYDKAMDAIYPLSWNSSLFNPQYPNPVNCNHQYLSSLSYLFSRTEQNIIINDSDFRIPRFDFYTYGYPLYSLNSNHILYLNATKRMSANSRALKADAQELHYDSVAESTTYTAGAYDLADDSYMAYYASPESTEWEDSEESGALSNGDVDFRPIEMPVAFFRPNLVAGSDGEIMIDFTVPNFNTTWNLNLGAYTSNLLSSSIQLETVASKSVMVKMNAPRFLRTGDEIILSATLYNNTAGNLTAEGIYEIFNPDNGEILKTETVGNLKISPSGNEVFSISFTCPSGISAIGLRAYGKTSNASDGEETVIPVLPSSQPVVESKPFYLKPSQTDLELSLPRFPDGASVTFSYCDNPLWEVVTSLSPVVKAESESVMQLVDALYANCVCLGVLDQNPDIRKGLEMIINGEAGDSLLISNLQKNQDLKIVSLNNTPWVNNAANETLRLSRLSTLLEDESAFKDIEALWKKITLLQNPDGGWSWCPGMKSSEWITYNVLLGLAFLKQYDCLPNLSSVNTAIRNGIRYCDKAIVTDYNKIDKKGREAYLNSIWYYLYLRSFYKEVSPATGYASISNEALKLLERNWKRFDIFDKASFAQLLWKEGRQKTALEILESIREFATVTDLGIYFDNQVNSTGFRVNRLATAAQVITAFQEIRPSDEIIDGLRQWLLLQKQSQDWQERSAFLYVVNAVLSSGTSWDAEYSMPEITIGDRRISTGEIGRLTGSCKIDLNPADLEGASISIRRSAPSPAWGAVLSQYIAPMIDVSEDGIAELKVSKEFLRLEEKDGKITGVPTNKFNIGDKVRINIIIQTDREMDYVVINDERAACIEPDARISGYTAIDGVYCYREMRNNATNFYIPTLRKGKFVISYDCSINEAGEFSSGIATVQSLYAPSLTAHSAGTILKVKK